MQYRMITDEDQMALLRERVAHLEAEHFRALLISFEVEDKPELLAVQRRAMADLQQRIERHLGPTEMPAPEGDKSGTGGEGAAGDPPEATAGRVGDEQPVTDDPPDPLNDECTSRPGG